MSRAFWFEGPGSIILAIALALTLRWLVIEAYVIPSGSMMPTLVENDHVFVNKLKYGIRLPFSETWVLRFARPQRGEVLVFKNPLAKEDFYIKRVVGLEGDKIFYEAGRLYVNDKLVDQSVPQLNTVNSSWMKMVEPGSLAHWEENLDGKRYGVLLQAGEKSQSIFGPYIVPAGHLFVLGDNRDKSVDSRHWDPQASRAVGFVEFVRQDSSDKRPIKIPAGTLLRTQSENQPIARFQTVEDLELRADTVRASIRAVDPGLIGNQEPGAIREVEVPIEGVSREVRQPEPTKGGDDRRFVPEDYLVGNAMRIWLSCDSRLPVLTFLCNPATIRWHRIFAKVD